MWLYECACFVSDGAKLRLALRVSKGLFTVFHASFVALARPENQVECTELGVDGRPSG